MKEKVEKFFEIKKNKSSISTEIMAGITTFMTMAYILAVHPNILAAAGMSAEAVFTATSIAIILSTLMMAFFAKYPFAVAPGMGINAFFAYTIGLVWGWQVALIAVFVEGILFLLIAFFNIRDKLFDSVPKNLKIAVSVGIGLFITFIGLVNAGIVESGYPVVALGDFGDITVLLAIAGIVLTMALMALKVKGAILFGILGTWVLGIIFQMAGLYVVDVSAGRYSLLPTGILALPPSLVGYNIFSALDYARSGLNIGIFQFIVIMFSFLFIDVFDAVGTVIGISEKAGFVEKDGKIPRLKQVMVSDAASTILGAGLGTSTTTIYIESMSGITVGGRTGLTALVTAALFLAAMFFSPLFLAIPVFATAPALIIVGFFMFQNVTKLDMTDITEALPAFLAVIIMPLTFDIAEGIIFGVLSYVVLKLVTGKRKDISAVMTVIAILFVLKHISNILFM